jgi:MoxR-like ATPase
LKTREYGLSEGLNALAEQLTDVNALNEAAEQLWEYFISVRKDIDSWMENDWNGVKAIFESPVYSLSLRKKIVDYILNHFEKVKGGAISVLENLAQDRKATGIVTIVKETLTLVRAIDVLRPIIRFEKPEVINFGTSPPEPAPADSDSDLQTILSLLNSDQQVILMGPPGVGKTHYALWCAHKFTDQSTNGNWLIIQFHQSFKYEDFIERVVFESGSSGLMTNVKPMTFVKLCHIADKNPERKYVVILDEINRADIPSVFGELLFALEYRGKEVGLTYSELPFSVPKNIYVLATANSIDRGTFEIGVALRRRFKIHMMEPSRDKLVELLSKADPDAKELALKIFDDVNKLYERRIHQSGIGQLFFRDVRTTDDLQRVWRHVIRPLLFSFFSALSETAPLVQGIDNMFAEKSRRPDKAA